MAHHVIGAVASDAGGGEAFRVVNPADSETVSEYFLAGTAEVDAAVTAARQAFPEWSKATPQERSAALTKLAAVLEEKAAELARTETRQTGKPIRLSSEF